MLRSYTERGVAAMIICRDNHPDGGVEGGGGDCVHVLNRVLCSWQYYIQHKWTTSILLVMEGVKLNE